MTKLFSYILFFTLVLQADFVFAHHLLEVKTLECSKEFPCPDEIIKRISFWISVYSKHGNNKAILHDSKNPERVYAILESTQEPCRFSKNRTKDLTVSQERLRIEELLRNIALKLEAGASEWSEEEQHTLAYFPNKDFQEVREAAGNVRCQAGNRDSFYDGLVRFSRYRDMVTAKVAKYNLSQDILYLPFVESSYNPKAYSRVGAAGMWQIMPKTARVLGLSISRNIDERFDPELATEGAMKYFRQSYETLESSVGNLGLPESRNQLGPFVITSYNYGIVGARDMLKDVGINFSSALTSYSGKRFKTAVQNFYASFLAARYVATNAGKYFGTLPTVSPPSYKSVDIQKDISANKFLSHMNLKQDQLRELNPSLTSRVWQGTGVIPKGFTLKMPYTAEEDVDAKIAQLWTKGKEEPPIVEEKAQTAEDETHYRVKANDTICNVAKKHKIKCDDFMKMNQLDSGSKIVPGQLLTLQQPIAAPSPTPEPEFIGPPPPPEQTKQALASVAPQEVAKSFGIGEDFLVSKSKSGKKEIYVVSVQSEETLGHFAEWLKLSSTAPIREVNRLAKSASISSGQTLTLPIQSEEQKNIFEEARIQYHKLLEEEFMDRYEIVGEEIYGVKPGDSETAISQKFEIPMWLLRRLNPGISTEKLKARDKLRIPIIKAKHAE